MRMRKSIAVLLLFFGGIGGAQAGCGWIYGSVSVGGGPSSIDAVWACSDSMSSVSFGGAGFSTSGSSNYQFGSGANSSTAAFSIPAIPNNPTNQASANCDSDETSRYLHANGDISFEIARRRITQAPQLISGQFVRVKYDDGGTEMWSLGSVMSSSPANSPVPNTRKCTVQG